MRRFPELHTAVMPKPHKGDTLFARTVPKGSARARRVKGVPEPTLGTRLMFGWSLLWISAVTIPFSFIQMATHQRWPTARNFKRWASRWGRTILGGMGLRVQVEQRAALREAQPYIFIANHQNLVDILALAGHLPHAFGFLAKAELARVPFLGMALRNSASVYIDRSSREKALESLKQAGAQIRGGHSVLFFAEGARSYGPAVQPFKKGAFHVALEAGVSVVPVTVLDSYRVMDERSYAARPGTVRMVVGTPIAPEEAGDVPGLMAAVRRQMETELAAEYRAAAYDEVAPGKTASNETVVHGTAQKEGP